MIKYGLRMRLSSLKKQTFNAPLPLIKSTKIKDKIEIPAT